jgi:hypothetical protein
MSTTQTSHEPSPAELDAHVSTGHDSDADPATGHGGDGHDDEHGHGGETLGPIDVRAWGALLLGIAAGLLVVLCLVITTTLLASPAAA